MAHAAGFELVERILKVVADEIQLLRPVLLGRMEGHFCRRQREDQPAAARVDRWQSEDIAKERPVGLGISSVDDHVAGIDHFVLQ